MNTATVLKWCVALSLSPQTYDTGHISGIVQYTYHRCSLIVQWAFTGKKRALIVDTDIGKTDRTQGNGQDFCPAELIFS